MTTRKTSPRADAYFSKAKEWQAELKKLRTIILGCQLTEELKWSKPCYSFENHNVVIIIPLKESCALMFTKGALLKDAKKILTKPGENTQAGRWIKFTHLREIVEQENLLKTYIQEAIEVEKAGLQVKYKTVTEYAVPEELKSKWKEIPALKTAFAALTPGRQKAYLIYFSAAKQSKTRESRIEKWMPQILKGKGLND
jgi:uncharacterized protein YdeI (YjbR/CyaY-like superfamily)